MGMWVRRFLATVVALCLMAGSAAADPLGAGGPDPREALGFPRVGSPLDDLPGHITHIRVPDGVEAPQRPEWSPDGRRLYFLSDNDVWEHTLHNGRVRNLTASFEPPVYRATPLSNGDLVLTAPVGSEGGRDDTEIWVLQRPLGARSPVLLERPGDDSINEGVAVSKEPGSTTIAWAGPAADVEGSFAEAVLSQVANTESYLQTGRIAYDKANVPRLEDVQMVLHARDFGSLASLEAQDLRTIEGRPGVDHEIIFTAYGHFSVAQIMGVERATRQVTDLSRAIEFTEAEGMEPGGRWILAERTTTYPPQGGPWPIEEVDLWRLSLDGEATWERLVFFGHYRALEDDPLSAYGSNSGVVHPDGTHFAFTLSGGPDRGVGDGLALLLFDLQAWDASGEGTSQQDLHRLPPTSIQPRS
jgi:hypothetical protein